MRKPQLIPAMALEIPPQILNEDLMTEKELAEAYKVVEEWHKLKTEKGD